MKKYKVNESYIIKRRSNGTFIISLENLEVYNLNESAALIFQSCKKGLNAEQIKTKLLKVYDVDEEEVDRDIDETFKFFLSKKIITEE